MQTLVFVNPLKPGKLEAAKAFMHQFMGSRKKEYIDMLKRYSLKNVKGYYHRIGDKEFSIVIHEIEKDAPERLAEWPTSNHPFDLWFKEQLGDLYDFEYAGEPQLLLDFDPNRN